MTTDPPDWVVVYRLTRGIRVKSTVAERREAVNQLIDQDLSTREIADRVNVDSQQVTRWRNRHTEQVRRART